MARKRTTGDRVVLWEAVADGTQWLAALHAMDAGERAVQPRPRPGVRRAAQWNDGQLMGLAASTMFSRDLADARLDGTGAHGLQVRAVTRDVASSPMDIARTFLLSADAPAFAGGASIEATCFLSPPLERLIRELGRALLEQMPARMHACMNQIVQFSPDRQFSGVLTGGADASRELTRLLPSAGLQPRSGLVRLHVGPGERLAACAIRTFRFDVPGVGEASRVTGFDSLATTIAAMDPLQTHYSCTGFAAGGICSATDPGWSSAVQDPRVSALLLLDGISFTGPWFRYAHVVDRLKRVPRERRRMVRDAGPTSGRGVRVSGPADFRDWPSHAEAREQFATLVSRRVDLPWIYTGGYSDRFLHPRQFRRAFGAPAPSPRVAMHYWPDCDYTFFARDHRDKLLDRVGKWMMALREQAGAKS